MDAGVTINRPPRDGHMAFVRTPDNISIELLQDGHLAAGRAVGVDAEHGQLVMPRSKSSASPCSATIMSGWCTMPASGETVVIDPAVAEPVLAAAEARGWRISQIWNTHWHPDHTGGNAAIKAATGCTITGPAAEAAKIPTLDRMVAEGDTVAHRRDRGAA